MKTNWGLFLLLTGFIFAVFISCDSDGNTSTADVPVTSVTLNNKTLTVDVGATQTLTETVNPVDATNKTVTWSSSDTAKATVDANGTVTGVVAGEATITVTTSDGNKTATCVVTVSEPDTEWTGSRFEVTVNTTTGPTYYSLKTGQEVTDAGAIASNAWDIAFQRTRLILTNSGDTAEALHSGGKGYVWFTEQFTMNRVSWSDRIEDDPHGIAWGTDKKRWVYGMPVSSNALNVMSYMGYESLTNGTNGDGSDQSKPLRTFLYNQKQFCIMIDMQSSNYESTGRVYIIRHGDGAGYSKIRMRKYQSTADTRSDVYTVEYGSIAVP